MNLYRLIYSSQAVSDLEYGDLKAIMNNSKKNNMALSVTGILCYGNSMFLQVLEGSRKTISQVFTKICADTRHFNIEIIEFSEIESRSFEKWSMNIVQLGTNSSPQLQYLITKHSSSNVFLPASMNGKQCLNFITELISLKKV